MRKLLLTLSLVLAFTVPAVANEPICKNGIIWTTKYGCEEPPPGADPVSSDESDSADLFESSVMWLDDIISLVF